MKIYKEIELRNFEAWSGAEDTMNTLRQLDDVVDFDVFSTLEICIDEFDSGVGETELNDILWFENDLIAEWLDFEDWEALERKANGEEIELEFSEGEYALHFEHGVVTIEEVDKSDASLPYLVKSVFGDYNEWCAEDELEYLPDELDNEAVLKHYEEIAEEIFNNEHKKFESFCCGDCKNCVMGCTSENDDCRAIFEKIYEVENNA